MRRLLALLGTVVFSVHSAAYAETKLTLMYGPTADAMASFVAEDLGYFAQGGLTVDFIVGPNPTAGIPALIASSAQISTAPTTSLIQATEQGLDLVVVASTHVFVPSAKPISGIIARNDSGIRTVADLLGKKVGVPAFGSPLDVLTRRWLESENADDRRVNWTEIGFLQMGDALKSDLVDAVVAVPPFYDRILHSDEGYTIGDVVAHAPAGTMPAVFISTREWATQHADAVAAFRAALNEAATYDADPAHQTSVIASVAKWTKLPPQAVTPASIPQKLQVHVQPDHLAFWTDGMRSEGMIKGDIDPAHLIAP